MVNLSEDIAILKLLLIDDDKIDRMNARRCLNKSGHSVEIVEAISAMDGLVRAQNEPFDLILLDYQLPTLTGLDLLRILYKSPLCPAPVIILSHSKEEHVALSCIGAGAQDFITKDEVTSFRLIRSILYAIERAALE